MALNKEQKAEISAKFGINANDTGSAHVQVAHLTARINKLQDHFKANHKDHSSRRGLLQMVADRRSFLEYVKKNDVNEYQKLIKELGLRK
jgi:small subunit ribosomal protein S15